MKLGPVQVFSCKHPLTHTKEMYYAGHCKCYAMLQCCVLQCFFCFFRSKNIGLGNGQRKSSEFEEFVLEKRKYLRNDVKLCERATQRVLLYSNNFLHKRLKTDPTVS